MWPETWLRCDGFQDLARPIAEGGDGGAELEALDEAVEVGLGELEDDAGHVLGRAGTVG